MAFICKHVSNHCSLKHSTTQIHANVALVFHITSSSKPFSAWIFHQAHLYRRKTSIIFRSTLQDDARARITDVISIGPVRQSVASRPVAHTLHFPPLFLAAFHLFPVRVSSTKKDKREVRFLSNRKTLLTFIT